MNLEQIAVGKATDKLSGHSYLPLYERLFAGVKDTHHPVLEVGAFYGGSLLMWAEYFPHAPIIGCEIDPSPIPVDAEPRIRMVRTDAYSNFGISFIESIGPFAVLIDDGPHTIESQLKFCREYPRFLVPGGIAIVEDVQSTSHFKPLAEAVPEGFTTAAVDLRHVKGRYDDLLLLIWKP